MCTLVLFVPYSTRLTEVLTKYAIGHAIGNPMRGRLFFGRDEATRTPDPYVPNVVRYQLRYIPMPNECQLQTAILLTQLAFSA